MTSAAAGPQACCHRHRCGPAVARRAHRAVPVGRSHIASAVRPPHGGPRRDLLATVVLVGVLAPAATLASDPPGLSRFMYAMGQVESHGNYYARNATCGAYGKYQIMPSNWPSWALRYLGSASAKPTPANQEIVAAGKFRSLYGSLDSWRRVAYWWLTGSSQATGWSTYATSYVGRVMTIYRSAAAAHATPAPAAHATPATQRQRQQRQPQQRQPQRPSSPRRPSRTATPRRARRSPTGAPGGRPARPDTPETQPSTRPGPAAARRSRSRAPRSSGTARSARPAARPGSSIDGTYLKTVDLTRVPSPRTRPSSARAGSGRQAHRQIAVLGTAGHPYVAIDGFTVAD